MAHAWWVVHARGRGWGGAHLAWEAADHDGNVHAGAGLGRVDRDDDACGQGGR